jgi:hypothetical protein
VVQATVLAVAAVQVALAVTALVRLVVQAAQDTT